MGGLFGKNQLSLFELSDLLLIGCDHGLVLGVDQASQQGVDLLLQLRDLGSVERRLFLALKQAGVPDIGEHASRHVQLTR
ncbi:MAG: hypothetical protein AAFY02_16190 [Pseudomonadota bacterium]